MRLVSNTAGALFDAHPINLFSTGVISWFILDDKPQELYQYRVTVAHGRVGPPCCCTTQVRDSGGSSHRAAVPSGQPFVSQDLDLSCHQLIVLPESLGQLVQLRRLDFSHTWPAALPASVGQLVALQQLGLNNSNPLTALPEPFGQHVALQTLDLSNHQPFWVLFKVEAIIVK